MWENDSSVTASWQLGTPSHRKRFKQQALTPSSLTCTGNSASSYTSSTSGSSAFPLIEIIFQQCYGGLLIFWKSGQTGQPATLLWSLSGPLTTNLCRYVQIHSGWWPVSAPLPLAHAHTSANYAIHALQLDGEEVLQVKIQVKMLSSDLRRLRRFLPKFQKFICFDPDGISERSKRHRNPYFSTFSMG